MLELVITTILNRYLGPYVENLDGTQLKLKLFTGKISLTNLVLRSDAITKLLELPVRVVAGKIGSINIDVSLSSLRSKPIVVQIDEVYVSLAPDLEGKPYYHTSLAETKAKLSALKDIETQFIKAMTGITDGVKRSASAQASQGDAQFLEGLIGSVIANLQFRISRVHVRYEHPVRITSALSSKNKVQSIVVGITMAEAFVSTTNESWVVEFMRKSDTVYKLMKFQGVSIYLDTVQSDYDASVAAVLAVHSQLQSAKGEEKVVLTRRAQELQRLQAAALTEYAQIFDVQLADRNLDAKATDTAAFTGATSSFKATTAVAAGQYKIPYVLRPVSLTMQLSIALGYPLTRPKADCTIFLGSVDFQVVDRHIGMLAHMLSDHAVAWERRGLRLPVLTCWSGQQATHRASYDSDDDTHRLASSKPKESPWKRVFTSILQRHRNTCRLREKQHFLQSISIEYCKLYLRRLAATEVWELNGLTASERRRYNELEADARLTFHDIIALRRAAEKWARAQLSLPLSHIAQRRSSELKYLAGLWSLDSPADASSSASSSTDTSANTSRSMWSRFMPKRTKSKKSEDAEMDAAIASITSEELAALYEGMGLSYDTTTGGIKVQSSSLEQAARVANLGLPMWYIWLRVNASIDSISVALSESGAAAPLVRGKRAEGMSLWRGSTLEKCSLRLLTRLVIERTTIGFDKRAVSTSFGLDIGDVYVVDCREHGSAVPSRTTDADISYRYILFSDHSQGGLDARDRAGSTFKAVADGIPTEDSICNEIEASTISASKGNGVATGGGSLPINPVHSGWLSLRVVSNPSDPVFRDTIAALTSPIAARKPVKRALYEDGSDDSDYDEADTRATGKASADADADSEASRLRVRLAARPLVFVWSPPWVRRMHRWLKTSLDDDLQQLTFGSRIQGAAIEAMYSGYMDFLVQNASSALESAILSEKSALDLRVYIAAPLIIIPERVKGSNVVAKSEGTPSMLIIDLGSIAATTKTPTDRHARSRCWNPDKLMCDAHHDSARAPETLCLSVEPLLSKTFDEYSVFATGLSLQLCEPCPVDPDEVYDPSRHGRFSGRGDTIMLQGLTGAPAKKLSTASFRKGSSRALVSAAEVLTREREVEAAHPWSVAVLGPPRVAWRRESAHYLLRDSSFVASLYAANGTITHTASMPQLLVQVNVLQAAVVLSTQDFVSLANVFMAAATAIPPSQHSVRQSQPLALRTIQSLRKAGFFVSVYEPYANFPPEFYHFYNPQDEILHMSVETVCARMGRRDRDNSSLNAQMVKAASTNPVTKACALEMLVEVNFKQLSLRLRHDAEGSTDVQNSHATVDIILDANGIYCLSSTYDDGSWQVATGANNVLLFAAAGRIPRALMLGFSPQVRVSGTIAGVNESRTAATFALSDLQVCLVRRNRRLLNVADRQVAVQLNSPVYSAPSATIEGHTPTYATILQELKADAAYIFEPSSIGVVVTAGSSNFQALPLRVLARLGAVVVSLSPYDAIMVVSLSEAMQSGIASVVESISNQLISIDHKAGEDEDDAPVGSRRRLSTASDADSADLATFDVVERIRYTSNHLRKAAEEQVQKAAYTVAAAAARNAALQKEEELHIDSTSTFMQNFRFDKPSTDTHQFELRLICERLQATLYTVVSKGNSKNVAWTDADDFAYRNQIFRVSMDSLALRITSASVNVSTKASAYYFNDHVMSWEPVLEPWHFLVRVSVGKDRDDSEQSVIRTSCVSSTPLAFTVSSSFLFNIPVMQRALEQIASARNAARKYTSRAPVHEKKYDERSSSPTADNTQGITSFAPFILVNESGCVAQVWRPTTGAVLGTNRSAPAGTNMVVGAGERVPISASFLALNEPEDTEETTSATDTTETVADAHKKHIASQLLRNIPTPYANGAEEDDAPELKLAGMSQQTRAQEGMGSSDVVSSTVVVTVNIQLAGYKPLYRRAINRTGSTYIKLEPLPSGIKEFRGHTMLLAGSDAPSHTKELRNAFLDSWQRTNLASAEPVRQPVTIAVIVEHGEGGCKIVRIRSLLKVHNSTRIPIVCRVQPEPAVSPPDASIAALADDCFKAFGEGAFTGGSDRTLFQSRASGPIRATAVTFGCSEAAVLRLPLDRVIPAGATWHVPVPYSTQSRIFVRPALAVRVDELKSVSDALVAVSDSDDAMVCIWATHAASSSSARAPAPSMDSEDLESELAPNSVAFLPDLRFGWSQYEPLGIDSAQIISALEEPIPVSPGFLGSLLSRKSAADSKDTSQAVKPAQAKIPFQVDGLEVRKLSFAQQHSTPLADEGAALAPRKGSQSKHIAVCNRSRAYGKAATADAAAGAVANPDTDFEINQSLISQLTSASFFYLISSAQPVVLMEETSPSILSSAPSPTAADTVSEVIVQVKPPLEIQNLFGCSVEYQIAIPTASYNRIVSDTMEKVEEAPKQSGSSLFSFGRKKKDASTTPTPTDVKATQSIDTVTLQGVASGMLGPAQCVSLLYAHPNAPLPPQYLETIYGLTTLSRSKYKQRLTMARLIRNLCIRFRPLGSDLQWSKPLMLWTPNKYDMPEEDAGSVIQALSGSLSLLPLLRWRGPKVISEQVTMVDAAGASTAYNCEHALGDLLDDTTVIVPATSKAPQVAVISGTALVLSLYCKYWMCNATGLPLLYSTAKHISNKLSIDKASKLLTVAAGQAQAVTEETYENQRFMMVKWTSKLLPTDRQAWSDRYGTNKALLTKESFVLPSDEWVWQGDWQLDMNGNVDADGWQYNVDFPRMGDSGWTASRNPTHFVRRRRWIRQRIPPQTATIAQAFVTNSLINDPLFLESNVMDAENVVSDNFAINPAALNMSAMLQLGIYMYGPGDGEENCSVRIADSEWSEPFALRNVGRPGLLRVEDHAIKLSEPDVEAPRHCYELVVSCNAASSLPSDATGGSLSFHRTMLVTIAPRYVIANYIDAHLAALQLANSEDTAGRVSSQADSVGVYFLQVAQAAVYDDTGRARPHPAILSHLDNIAPRKLAGGETRYDTGNSLYRKLESTAEVLHGNEDGVARPAFHSDVPLVLTVPPGEHCPLYWPFVPGVGKAMAKVCVRVARLSRDETNAKTILVPVTDWSGALDLSQLSQTPFRVSASKSTAARQMNSAYDDVFLRLESQADKHKGSITALFTMDAGLMAPHAIMQNALRALDGGESSERQRVAAETLVCWRIAVGELPLPSLLSSLRAAASAAGLPSWLSVWSSSTSHATSVDPDLPLFRVDNHTYDTFEVRQTGLAKSDCAPLIVPPKSSVILAWDEPMLPLVFVEQEVIGRQGAQSRSFLPAWALQGKSKDKLTDSRVAHSFTFLPLLQHMEGVGQAPSVDLDVQDVATPRTLVLPMSQPVDVSGKNVVVIDSDERHKERHGSLLEFGQPVLLETSDSSRRWQLSGKSSAAVEWRADHETSIIAYKAMLDDNATTAASTSHTGATTTMVASKEALAVVFVDIGGLFGSASHAHKAKGGRPHSNSIANNDALTATATVPSKESGPHTVRFGDIVMVRHDLLQKETDDDGELDVSRTTPLYLTAFRDGQLCWVDGESAQAAVLTREDGSGKKPPACPIFIVVGGEAGERVSMNRPRSRAGSVSLRDTPTHAVEEGSATPSSFALMPIFYDDRLVEASDLPSTALRQCRIPGLTKIADTKAVGVESAPEGGRVISNMQRRRMAARGVVPAADVGASSTATTDTLSMPSSAMPTELRLAIANESLERVDALIERTKGISTPKGDVALGDDFPIRLDREQIKSLLECVYQVKYLPTAPTSCLFAPTSISSQVLPKRTVAFRIAFDGPTRVISVQTTAERAESAASKTPEATPSSNELLKTPAANLLSLFSLQIQAAIPEAYVSFVDASPQELVLLSLHNVGFNLSVGIPYWTSELVVGDIQIDNQLSNPTFPVLLCRSSTGMSAAGAGEEPRPFLHVSVVYHVPILTQGFSSSKIPTALQKKSSVLNFRYLSLLVQEMDIRLEEALIRRIFTAIPQLDDGVDEESDDEELFNSGPRAHWKAKSIRKSSRFGALTGMRDTIAASIVKSAMAKPRRSQVGVRGAVSKAKAVYAPIGKKIAAISASAKRQAARDWSRLKHLQAATVAAVSKSAVEATSAITEKLSHRPRQGSGAVEITATSASFTADEMKQRRRHTRHGMDSELAEIAGPVRHAANSVNKTLASTSLSGPNDASEHTTNYDIVDTGTLLASCVQVWWPHRMAARRSSNRNQFRRQLFIQHMVINAVSAKLSFVRDPLCVQEAGSSSILMSPLSVVLNTLGLMALSLQSVPLKLNGLEFVAIMAEPSDVMSKITQHYVSSALSEVYKVVFASDMLGNPVAVVGALGAGVRDFFVEPAQGIIHSPAAFGKGLLKGTGSLMKHTVVGLGVGVGSLTASVGRGVASLTFDAEYLRDRAERAARRMHERPAHVGQGLLEGGKDLGRGIAQGLAGVVLDPIKGAEAEGAAGFVKGVGKGIAGLVAKPVAGLLDMAARTTEGIVATAKAVGGDEAGGIVYRQRNSRVFWGIDRVIVPALPVHDMIISVMRKALEVAVEAERVTPKAKSQGPSNKRGKSDVDDADAVIDDVKDVMTGKEALIRAALANISNSYMHHILWPQSPYLCIISSRSCIFANVSRTAANRSNFVGQTSSVVNLCWQTPVVTAAALRAASAASLQPSNALLLDTEETDAQPVHARRTRATVTVGLMAGHVAFTNLLDSMGEMVAAVREEAAARRGASADEDSPQHRAVTAAALMRLDSSVQSSINKLWVLPVSDPTYHMPHFIVKAMTVYTEPTILHFSDAIATLANVRADVHPRKNIESITLALAYVDTVYAKYCKDRAAFLRINPQTPHDAGELERYERGGALEADDLMPIFHFIFVKANVDKPVLCAVLASMWLLQEGLHDGRDGFALSMFKSACTWAASISPKPFT